MAMDLAFEISGDRSRTRVVLPASALVQPVTVGTAGQLRIKAPRVLAEHAVFMLRDGRLRGASASQDNPVMIDGKALPCAWTDLPLPCSMQIGGVRVDVHPAAPAAVAPSGGRVVAAPAPPPVPPPRPRVPTRATRTPGSGVSVAPPPPPPVLPMPPANMSFIEPAARMSVPPAPPSMPTRVQSIDELVQRRAAAQREADESLGGVEQSLMDITGSRDPKLIAQGVLSRLRADWRRTTMRIKVCGAVLPALAVFVLSSPSGASVQPRASMADDGTATGSMSQDLGAYSASPAMATAPQQTPEGAMGVAPVATQMATAAPRQATGPVTQAPQYVVTQPSQGPMPQVFVPNAGLPPPVSAEEASLRRQAMDALFAGDFPRAQALYQSLAGGRPDIPQYAATARVLASKTKGR